MASAEPEGQLTSALPERLQRLIEKLVGQDKSTGGMRTRMARWVTLKQYEIVAALEQIEGGNFRRDEWERQESGGGGITCVMQQGKVFEKAGVNVSIVHGSLPEAAILKMRDEHDALRSISENTPLQFFATGISLIVHPINPHAPTTHMNYRYFEVAPENGTAISWWFGGGADLTPSVLYEEDAVHFHMKHKVACDKHDPTFYDKFKKNCDEYFWIPHRKETRGLGGIIFDDLDCKDSETLFAFIQSVSDIFIPAYIPILKRRINSEFTEQEKLAQLVRRGHYVEFNLMQDRGTAFGLRAPYARIESILCSMPLNASWIYDYQPQTDNERTLYEILRHPKQWINA